MANAKTFSTSEMDNLQNQAEADRKFHKGKSNPSGLDWLFRISLHPDPERPEFEVTETMLTEAFEAHGWAWTGQVEKGGNTGYLHWQGFLQSPTATRLSTIRRAFAGIGVPHPSWIARRQGTVTQAVAYCTKEATRVHGPYLHGEINQRLDVNSISAVEQALREGTPLHTLMLDPDNSSAIRPHLRYLERLEADASQDLAQATRKVHVRYVWGDPGIGKTYTYQARYPAGDSAYWVTDYNHPWDSYTGQSTLVLDEYAGDFSPTSLNHYLEGYPCELPARYANGWARWTNVIIISNLDPESLYPKAPPKIREAVMRRLCEVEWWSESDLGITQTVTVPEARQRLLARFPEA